VISPELEALIRYRMEQATEAAESAQLLLQNNHLRDAVNRAYYAMFYAALALLAFRGKGASKHSGVLSIFDAEFVRPGIFARECSEWMHRMFNLRQRADYHAMFQVSEETAREALERATAFVSQVKEFFASALDRPG